MKLGRVSGTVVATICAAAYAKRKLLICDLIDPSGTATGDYLIAIDQVGAGPGDDVLILDEGNSARQILESPDAPVRAIIVGIVDRVHLG